KPPIAATLIAAPLIGGPDIGVALLVIDAGRDTPEKPKQPHELDCAYHGRTHNDSDAAFVKFQNPPSIRILGWFQQAARRGEIVEVKGEAIKFPPTILQEIRPRNFDFYEGGDRLGYRIKFRGPFSPIHSLRSPTYQLEIDRLRARERSKSTNVGNSE